MSTCPDCGHEHLGSACGMTFAQRIRTVRMDSAWMPARNTDRRNYFDSQAVDDAFGEDSKDRMMEVTQGYGAAHTDPKTGEVYARDRHGDMTKLDAATIEKVYLGAED